jgi:hypothetical protein
MMERLAHMGLVPEVEIGVGVDRIGGVSVDLAGSCVAKHALSVSIPASASGSDGFGTCFLLPCQLGLRLADFLPEIGRRLILRTK